MTTSYQVERVEVNCSVTVNGALTAIVVPELKEVLNRELQHETRKLVFDLRETKMLDSSGIGLLIASSNTLRKKGGHMRVINPSKEIFDLLSNMRLVTRFNVPTASE